MWRPPFTTSARRCLPGGRGSGEWGDGLWVAGTGSVASGVLPTFPGTAAPTCEMGTQGDTVTPAQGGPHECVCTRAWRSPPTHSTALGGGRAPRVTLGWPGCRSCTPAQGQESRGGPRPQPGRPCPAAQGPSRAAGLRPACPSARPPLALPEVSGLPSTGGGEPDSANRMFSISHLLCAENTFGTWHRG